MRVDGYVRDVAQNVDETVRCWVLKFEPLIARRLRRHRPRPSNRWHLDEMVVRTGGKRRYRWRAVDHEGEVPDMLVHSRRDSRAARRLMRKLLKKYSFAPKCWSPTSWLLLLGVPAITAELPPPTRAQWQGVIAEKPVARSIGKAGCGRLR